MTLVSLEQSVPSPAGSFLRVFTTKPTRPPYVHLAVGQSAVLRGARRYDCLCAALYQTLATEDGRHLSSHQAGALAGGLDVAADGTCTLSLVTSDGVRQVVLARATLRVSARPSRDLPEPYDSRGEILELRDMSQAWWRAGVPVDAELRKVHVAALPAGALDFFPGCWFSVQLPAGGDPEALFERALRAAARRRGVALSAALADRDLAPVVAEALAAVPNCFPYNADEVHAPGGDRLGDWFEADARNTDGPGDPGTGGDCEDLAREVLTLAHSLREGTFVSPIVRAAQRVLRHYVVGQHFSAVRLGWSPGLEGYSTGGKLYAHSHVVFLPARDVRRALRGAAVVALPDGPADLPVLCADGIALFEPRPEAAHPCATKALVHSDRLGRYSTVGLDYYMFCSSFYLTEGAVATEAGTPVRELVYHTGDRYGARFGDIVDHLRGVELRAPMNFTARGEQLARDCVAYLPPIKAYKAGGGPPDCTHLLEALGATLLAAPPAGFRDTFFLKLIDFDDEAFLAGLAAQVPAGLSVGVLVDAFAEGCATAQVFLY